jgi:hypothetical protein
LIRRGDDAQAIDLLNKSVKVVADSAVLLSLAVCHQELGQCYRQLEMLDSAIDRTL